MLTLHKLLPPNRREWKIFQFILWCQYYPTPKPNKYIARKLQAMFCMNMYTKFLSKILYIHYWFIMWAQVVSTLTLRDNGREIQAYLDSSSWNANFFFDWNTLNTQYCINSKCCCSVSQSCPTPCDPMDGSMPGFPVLHHLPEPAQTHVYCVRDAIQPSHPLLSPSPAKPKVYNILIWCICIL